jgi:hypothetical protein
MDLNSIGLVRRDEVASTEHKKKTGVFPLVIGAGRALRGTDGKLRHFKAHQREAVIAAAKVEGRELKIKIIDLNTGRIFDKFEELRAMYPDAVSMRLRNQDAPWAYWCEDNADPKAAEKLTALEREIAGRKKVIAELQAKLPKMDDVGEFDAATGKIEIQTRTLQKNEADRERIVESIIGLLSDELHPADLPPMPPQPLNAA